MQLKGLVRFFTVVLIIVSVYQLSFTWFIKGHEKKMQARALSYVKTVHPEARQYTSMLHNFRIHSVRSIMIV